MKFYTRIFAFAAMLLTSMAVSAQYTIHVEIADGEDLTYDLKDVELFRWWNTWNLEIVNGQGRTVGEFAPGDFKRIYWTKNPDEDKPANGEFIMTEDKLSVTTADYSIGFDPTAISDSSKLTVKQVYNLQDPFDGNVRRAVTFDFNLQDINKGTQITELAGTAEIRIPLTVDDGYIPCAAYYNPETKAWQAIDHYYDHATGEIVITTSHLSKYGAFSVSKEYTREAMLTYIYFPWTESNMGDLVRRLKRIVDSPSPERQAFEEYMDDLDLTKSLGLDFGYSSLESMGFLPSFCEEFNDLLSNVGVAMNVYQVCRAAYKDQDEAVAAGTLKLIIGSITQAASSAIQTSIMTASMAAVAFIDYSLNKFATEAVEGRKDIYRAAYRHYYSKAGSECATYQDGFVGYRSAPDWYNIFYPIMSRTDLDEKALTTLIDDTVRVFCNQIWEDELGLAAAMNAARGMGWTGGGGLNEQIKKELSDEYRSDLYNGVLVSVFQAIKNHLEADDFEQLEKKVMDFGTLMNRVATLKFVDSSASSQSAFAGFKVKLASIPTDVQDPEMWECTLDETGKGYIQFRVFPYVSYGFQPRLVLVNKDGEEVKEYSFSLDYANNRMQPTTIDLSTAGTDIPAAVDEWNFEFSPAIVQHSSGAQFPLRDEWNEGLRQLFNIHFESRPDGAFTTQNEGLSIQGNYDTKAGAGSGTFTVDTSYEYTSPTTIQQREISWTDAYNTLYDKVNQGENATMVTPPDSILDNWVNCQVEQHITGTFTMRWSEKEQKYKIEFSGDGTFSIDGTGIYQVEYDAKNRKASVLTDHIQVPNGNTRMEAVLYAE